jgi:hypothetical protein
MGFLKKLTARAATDVPDFQSEVGKCLPAGEQIIALGQGMPEAHGGEVGGKRISGYAVNKAIQAVSESRHIAGDADSCAQAIPRGLQTVHFIAITNQSLSFWDFGATGVEVPPNLLVSFPRSSVRGIVPTGKESYGMKPTRISFVDDSFVDFKIYDLGGFDDAMRTMNS